MYGRGQSGSGAGGIVGAVVTMIVVGGIAMFGGFKGNWNNQNNAGWQPGWQSDQRLVAEMRAREEQARKEAGELAAAFDARGPRDLDGFQPAAGKVRAILTAHYAEGQPAAEALDRWLDRATRAQLDDLVAAPTPAWFTLGAAGRRRLAEADEAVARRLRAGEAEWAERRAKGVTDAAAELARTDPATARARYAACAKELAALPSVETGEKFFSARKRLCAAALETARWQMRPHVAADRFVQAEAEARAVAAEWKDEAKATGLTADYTRFADGFAYLAALARLADKP